MDCVLELVGVGKRMDTRSRGGSIPWLYGLGKVRLFHTGAVGETAVVIEIKLSTWPARKFSTLTTGKTGTEYVLGKVGVSFRESQN